MKPNLNLLLAIVLYFNLHFAQFELQLYQDLRTLLRKTGKHSQKFDTSNKDFRSAQRQLHNKCELKVSQLSQWRKLNV